LAAAGLAAMVVRASGVGAKGNALIAVGVALAFLPQLAWHNALWGFQSQVYFSLGFSILALRWLGVEGVAGWQRWAGLAAGGAGLLAMGGAALVPVALIGLVGLRAVERRRWSAARSREVWPAVGLLVAAWALRAEMREHAALQAQSAGQWGGDVFAGAGLAAGLATVGGVGFERAVGVDRGGACAGETARVGGRRFCRAVRGLGRVDGGGDGVVARGERGICRGGAVALRGFFGAVAAGECMVRGGAGARGAGRGGRGRRERGAGGERGRRGVGAVFAHRVGGTIG